MSTATIKDWRDYPPGKEKYQLYLASREWAVIKEKVRARSSGRCERCFDDNAANVHHQTYERIYQERLEDLVHVCIPCHEFLSGKRNDDPVLSAPPTICGDPFRSVYLAGKITGTKWRDQILPGWSEQNDGPITEEIFYGPWRTLEGCISLPNGKRVGYAGPFWRPVEDRGGHGSIEDAWLTYDNHGTQFSSPSPTPHSMEVEPHQVWQYCFQSIQRSDLVFAWIDQNDCYGTLYELGIAAALHKWVCVAAPPSFQGRELWLPMSAGIRVIADSPLEAWDKFATKWCR